MKPSPLRPIGKAVVRIPHTYPHVYIAREPITEPIIQLDVEPARPIPIKAVKKWVKPAPAPVEPVKAVKKWVKPAPIVQAPAVPAPKKMMKKIGRAIEPVIDLIQAEQAQGQIGEAVPIERGNRFLDMFQLAGGIPTSQYLNLSELPGLATSTPELATTIRALPEGLVKPDPTFDIAWDKVKDYAYLGSFLDEYMEDFINENGLPKKMMKKVLLPIDFLVLEKDGVTVVYLDDDVYINPWLPPYDGWVVTYRDYDSEEEYMEVIKNYFRNMYDRYAKDAIEPTTKLDTVLDRVFDVTIPHASDTDRIALVKEYGKLLKQKGRKHDGYTRASSEWLRNAIDKLLAYPDKHDSSTESERKTLVKEYGKLLKRKGKKHEGYTTFTIDKLQTAIDKVSTYPDK